MTRELAFRSHRRLALLLATGLLLGGCAKPPAVGGTDQLASLPLPNCMDRPTDIGTANTKCAVSFFAPGTQIGQRNLTDFPRRYLELYRPEVRAEYCSMRKSVEPDCDARLKILAHYFNPTDSVPTERDIGLALEGGGTKSAAFALGTLAGLQSLGLLGPGSKIAAADRQITSIGSVSGGTYAASYFYNRWFDRVKETSGEREDVQSWFNYCIPSYFLLSGVFGTADELTKYECSEKIRDDSDRIRDAFPTSRDEFFPPQYRYMGHVWTNRDLLKGASAGTLDVEDGLGPMEIANVAWLLGETLVTVPFQFVDRTIFRWPLNSAPTKLAYKLGLERAYGYSPKDWQEAGWLSASRLYDTLYRRRQDRTLMQLGKNLKKDAEGRQVPKWIILTTAPGRISGREWLDPSARDPVRQQFEMSWDSYGSGTYGYAFQAPGSYYDLSGVQPDSLPIVDAVVASAAFFDDDETRLDSGPGRAIAGGFEHFINLTWFTEIPNFNVGSDKRTNHALTPYPAYLPNLKAEQKTPYIHLQDGGNGENSGILPLLRRGYKTILYAHGTLDNDAQWESICHLKNHLELDKQYRLDSKSLEAYMAKIIRDDPITAPVVTPAATGRKFKTYLDGQCSSQFDKTDLAAFDKNPDRDDTDPPTPAVEELYCSRLEGGTEGGHCQEFKAKYEGSGKEHISDGIQQAFFTWTPENPITFEVRRTTDDESAPPLATIIPIVPAISFADFAGQVEPKFDHQGVSDWPTWCGETGDRLRAQSKIKVAQCFAPDDSFGGLRVGAPKRSLPCIAMAHLLNSQCVKDPGSLHPGFPQDDFVEMTLHTTYLTYAAYFDLARHQVEDIVCRHPELLSGMTSLPPNVCGAHRP